MTLKGRYVLLFRKYLYFRSSPQIFETHIITGKNAGVLTVYYKFYTDIHEGCVKTKRGHQKTVESQQ